MKDQRGYQANTVPSRDFFARDGVGVMNRPLGSRSGAFASRGTNLVAMLLSTRERDVLHWLAQGKTGGEIGMILSISVYTVRAHIRNIVRKLNASNTAHAVARGFRSGLLDPWDRDVRA